jgi:hypothetical protein
MLGVTAPLRYGHVVALILLFSSTTINGALTEEQRERFQHQGFLYIPDYFSASPNDSSLLNHLLRAGDDLIRRSPSAAATRTFSTYEAGLIFGFKDELYSVGQDGEYENEHSVLQDIVLGFRNVALRSSLVDTAADLMQLDPNSQNMRILR